MPPSLGNLAENPTESKNRKTLFRERRYGADITANTSRSTPCLSSQKHPYGLCILDFYSAKTVSQNHTHLSENPTEHPRLQLSLSSSAGTVPRLQGQICPQSHRALCGGAQCGALGLGVTCRQHRPILQAKEPAQGQAAAPCTSTAPTAMPEHHQAPGTTCPVMEASTCPAHTEVPTAPNTCAGGPGDLPGMSNGLGSSGSQAAVPAG